MFGFAIGRHPKPSGTAEPTPPPPDPPPSGFLPYEDGKSFEDPIVAPFMAYIFDSEDNYTGFEGCIIGTHYILTSASVAKQISESGIKNFVVKVGGWKLNGNDFEQTLGINATFAQPGWAGEGDFENDIGLIEVDEIVESEAVVISRYSAAYNTEPYSGEYFYPPGTVVCVGGMEHWDSGSASQEDARGFQREVITNGQAQDWLGIEVKSAVIAIYNAGVYNGGMGTPMMVAGYDSWFTAGPLCRQDTGAQGATLFCRASYHDGWIESTTGIPPIIYPAA